MPHSHFMIDAYGSIEEHANNLMAVNELLNKLSTELQLRPVMPPFLVPYYYCADAEDGGISAFQICEGGHVTIHTFPYRSCYFVDILTDVFVTQSSAEEILRKQLYAERINTKIIDRRTIYSQTAKPQVDFELDFGPHYMIEVNGANMDMAWIYNWLDNIAPKINMRPITRPYVICDKVKEPSYISGMLVVAQSHIAVHYDIKSKQALIDIFSCEFLEDSIIQKILEDDFNEQFCEGFKSQLYSRGSKHKYKRKNSLIATSDQWRINSESLPLNGRPYST